MKNSQFNKLVVAAICAMTLAISACSNDDGQTPDLPITFIQEDQMGRPAINTVFVTSASKDAFNTTVPSQQGAQFQSAFETQLLALNAGYTTNLLGLDASTFTGVLATDVLTVSLDGITTFFDGTNVLTGRALADDVIDVELILIFGGPDASANSGLTSDNVSANDKPFLTTFPYLAAPF